MLVILVGSIVPVTLRESSRWILESYSSILCWFRQKINFPESDYCKRVRICFEEYLFMLPLALKCGKENYGMLLLEGEYMEENKQSD